jgi:hypothetical protein
MLGAISVCSFEFRCMGHPPQGHYISGSRLDTHWVLTALLVPESGKVCICVLAVKLKTTTQLEGEDIILDSLQIPTDVFHSSGLLVASS